MCPTYLNDNGEDNKYDFQYQDSDRNNVNLWGQIQCIVP